MSCVICAESFGAQKTVIVREKGLETLKKFSVLRTDGLLNVFESVDEIKLHSNCRKKYTRENAKGVYLPLLQQRSENAEAAAALTVASTSDFEFRKKCFFCAQDINSQDYVTGQTKLQHDKREIVCTIGSDQTKSSIIGALTKEATEINQSILRRIENIDLKEQQARYHKKCYTNTIHPRKGLKRGRPESSAVSEAIEVIHSYMEDSGDPQFSLQELKGLLDDYVPDDRTILAKLQTKYEGRLRITTTSKETILTLLDSGSDILTCNWYSQRIENLNDEKLRLVKKAAEIIRHDIRIKLYEKHMYPAPHSFLENANNDVPESLELFLKTLAGKQAEQEDCKRKWLSMAHSIILLVRPKKFLSSILTALAVTVKKKFASRWLIDILNRLGFCSSYSETNVFEVSAVNFGDYESVSHAVETEFVQYVFDNADVNINTLDGHNTFHAMGGIECTSPLKTDLGQLIPRVNKVPSAQIIGSFGHVPLQHYNKTNKGLQTIIVKDLQSEKRIVPRVLNIVWLYGRTQNIPDIGGWNGFMQHTHKDEHYEMTQVKALPFINAPPSNYDTVNTALVVARERTVVRGQTTTFITFDQPLYAKAREIVASSSDDPLYKNIVVRIGGFHLLMSYMGSIGFTMAGSGIKELWSLIYAPATVNHMLSGHAYARALRAHQLTYIALGQIILHDMTLTESQITDIETFLFNISDSNISKEILKSESFEQITSKFEETLSDIEQKGPTAKLWIQYFKMVCLIQNFIEAERSGNFILHLETVKQMLPVFVATGHFNYGKSLITYLQDMDDLKHTMPAEEYEKFTTGGLFTIRRTDQFWSGVWSDMVIEQSLMRTMKVSGGLTSGRSMTDSVLAKWILSMPVVQKVEECLETFCGLNSNGENIHIDSTPSRLKRDESDVMQLLEWFHEHPPFRDERDKIVSLSTGVAGDANRINCHDVFVVGQEILSKKVGLKFTDLSYARRENVVPIAQINSSVTCNDKSITLIDPLTIFQRISFLKKGDEEMKDYLHYELAPYPLALFDECGIRKSKKSALYDLFTPQENINLSGKVHYVIDGGHLLHRVVWRKGDTYDEICLSMINYLKKHYGQSLTTVFDGYDEQTEKKCTKETERLRRSSRKTAAEVIFNGSMTMTTPQEFFLSNNKNKSRFIKLLNNHLQQHNIASKQSESDADRDIVSEAFRLAETEECVVVVGEDIDLLVLIVACNQNEKNIHFLKPGKGKQQTRIYNSTSFQYPEISHHLLTLHAFGGCDTTSSMYNIGKKIYFTTANRKPELGDVFKTFTDKTSSHDEIAAAGEKFTAVIYGGEMTQCLDSLRYEKFSKNLTKNKLNLACLPPTKAAARQHALRVYHQVQLWTGNVLEPTDYGWTIQNNILNPVKTLLPPAPDNIMKMIFCKCKTNCGRQCGCRKSGLTCSDICTNCKGQSCLNRQNNISLNEKDTDTEEESDCEDPPSNVCTSINTRGKKRRTT